MKRNFHLLFIRQALYLLIGFVILEEYFILLGSDQPLQNVYGLTFDNSGMAWSNEEINILASWLGSLPPSLATIGKKSPYGFIRVIKEQNYSALPAIMMQSGFTETKFATLYLSKSKDLSINEIKMQIIYRLLEMYDYFNKISELPEWREMSGWRFYEYFGFKLPWLIKPALNQDPRGFAHLSGMIDARKDFLTFGVLYFLGTKEMESGHTRCLNLRKWDFFKTNFPDYRSPIDISDCILKERAFLDDIEFTDPFTKKTIGIGPIDDSTVTGFELLYATPGVGDVAEVAGHLLLRIKLNNNPEAFILGIENPLDLVVAFLADTPKIEKKQDTQPLRTEVSCQEDGWFDLGRHEKEAFDPVQATWQALQGLSGGFLTTFDRTTLYETVKSYTEHQDRNLIRYELLLTPTQKRSLIKHLLWVKNHFKSKYYFFDRNCASVLFQVIGEGIGDEEIAHFDPLVSPPNSLIAFLIRRGIAREIGPSFYSYRKRGFMAQEFIIAELKRIIETYPDLSWPSFDAILSRSDETRMHAYEKFEAIAQSTTILDSDLYNIANLAQDAELAFGNHEKNCQDYTSRSLATVREIQKIILSRNSKICQFSCPNSRWRVEKQFVFEDAKENSVGSSHTGLYKLTSALGVKRVEGSNSKAVLMLNGTLYEQEMGSFSRYAMQRGGYANLGEVGLNLEQGHKGKKPDEWWFRGLILRKFKERLDNVPSYWNEYGQLGLGLRILDTHVSERYLITDVTYVGGELLANLMSSKCCGHLEIGNSLMLK